jgi:L-aspartate oxidase
MKARDRLQRAMTEGAGVLRSTASLAAAAGEVADVAAAAAKWPAGRAAGEVTNLAAVAGALLRSADARVETRGAHARVEYPGSRPEWRRRLVHGRFPDGAIAAGAPGPS